MLVYVFFIPRTLPGCADVFFVTLMLISCFFCYNDFMLLVLCFCLLRGFSHVCFVCFFLNVFQPGYNGIQKIDLHLMILYIPRYINFCQCQMINLPPIILICLFSTGNLGLIYRVNFLFPHGLVSL